MRDTIQRFTLFSALLYSCQTIAGGPSVIAGVNGHTAVTYENPAITVHVENGDLGTLSNAVAVTLMQEAFNTWNNVSTSTITLSIDQAILNFDIDQNNAEDYLPTLDKSNFNADDNINPIVFDSDGQIIDKYFGPGQSEFIIGFAQSINTITGNFFLEGFVVINGRNSDTNDEIKRLMMHEIGHFFGLDHSQLNINNNESFFSSPGVCTTTSRDNYPLMYPVRCRDILSLHSDDISAISALYPSADVNDSFGVLEGIFVDSNGQAILGANIWVENTTTGETYSIVSDYLTQGTGYYKLLLPAGSYTLHANSINTDFVSESNVGPYSTSLSDRSFTSPHPITAVTYQGDTEGSDEVISMSTNTSTTINFSISGSNFVIVPGASDSNDSIGDILFGATSHIMLLIMSALLMFGRRRLKN